ncbi:MAG: endo-1,4-beta-xylanase [Fibrobacter sp.]|uniref:endo-1,4-beta-xylanase n=1 Tax=Fibrobacter sp. TaxID=35828 RepID=UPI0025BDD2F3|nr:endo-1,4-beta-xylanase [Fibrobacter sp.]MBQ7079594.1 endo-1,4-beta-xylanase [Fibrobacter sp.]
MKSNIIKSVMTAALLGGAVSAFAGPGLADGAAKFVGNITTRGQVRSDFTQLWNQITAENECKWASIEGSRGRYNWSGCDAAFNWAKNNGGHFKFHALVWGSQYPNWLNGLSAAETKKAITAWMDAVKQHYPELEMIDVVNEAIKSGGKYHSNYGPQGNNNIIAALGGDNGNYEFVAEAFRMARERWPKAILIYNDYNTVQWQKNEGIDLIQKLKKAGAPVDAYGLQAHDMMSQGGGAGGTGGGGSCLSINTLKSTIEEIWNKTQIPLFISEYDIFTSNDNVQKQCYQEQISYFMENEHIAGITIWGYIYGATWNDGTSGIIKDNKDRPAMTWLKDYLSKNKGANTTGLETGVVTPVEPEPQLPFKGEALAVPGKIEVEDFDIPGKGKNEDGTSNESYGDDTENHGDSDYRKDTGADLYQKATGVALGYNTTGDWFEYTINVAEAGDYTAVASVATEGTGAFTLSLDGKSLAEFEVTGTSYDDFSDVKKKVTLPAGKHVLRLDVTQQYFDIDYINFVKGEVSDNPGQGGDNPGQGGDEPGPISISQKVHMEVPTLGAYDVFDMNGVRLGRMRAYTMDEAVNTLKNTSDIKVQGIYMLRSVKNGMTKTVRVTR